MRQDGTIPWLRPDAKSQVTIEYDGYTPVRVDTVVVSTQHAPSVTHAEIVKTITEAGHRAGPAAGADQRLDHVTTSTRRGNSSSAVRTAIRA